MKRQSFNKTKLNERLRDHLSAFIRQGLNDTRLQFVSITKVELNKDNSVAKVYWDTFNLDEKIQVKDALHSSVGRLKNSIARNLELRITPIIELIYDAQFEEEAKIDRLLNEIKK